MVVAQVNDHAIKDHQGIVANPNCTTMVVMMAAGPLHRAAGLKAMSATSYQAVSGSGQTGKEVLTHEPQHTGTDLAEAVRFLGRVARKRSVAFVISDFLDHGYGRPLAIARQKHDLIGVLVSDRVRPEFAAFLNFWNVFPMGYAGVDAKLIGIGGGRIGVLVRPGRVAEVGHV